VELLIRRVLAIRSAESPRVGPDGSIYYLSDITGTMQLWRFDGTSHDLVLPWSSRVHDYELARDGALAFTSDRGGSEKWQLYVVDGDEIVEASAEGVNYLGAWSPDAQRLAFSSTRDSTENFYVYIYDRGARGIAKVVELPGLNFVEEWSEAGIFITHYETNLDSTIYMFRDGELKELTKHGGEALNFSPKYIGSGKLAFLTNMESECVGVAIMELSTGSWKYLVQLDREVELLDAWGNYIAFAANEEGASGLYLMHTPSGLVHRISTPRGVVTSMHYSKGILAFSLSSINRGHEVYSYRHDAVVQVTRSPRLGISLERVPEPESVWYASHDGRRIHANIYRPPGSARGVVVHLHGGPESQDRPALKPLTAALLLSGIVVAAPNYRGSTGYGRTFVHLDDVERRWDAIRDVEAFARWLAEQGISRQRPCVMGSSYGGYLALMALATAPHMWACGVEISGMFNLVTFLERTAPWRRRYREAEYGSLERHRDVLLQLSPASHVDKIKAPLMIVHGANDTRVPVSEAEELAKRLRELGREVELLILPDEGHAVSKVESRVAAYAEVVKFVMRHLEAS
jgi:dipeptidyl aminopeptidase/acylaminoacyl peptidase